MDKAWAVAPPKELIFPPAFPFSAEAKKTKKILKKARHFLIVTFRPLHLA